jgi:3-isopropylmalate dehydrogenase
VSGEQLQIAVLPGDGIGTEVTAAAIEVMEAARARTGGFKLHLTHYPAGASAYQQTGTALSEKTVRALESADAVLLGAMGLPHVRYPDGTEISPQLDIRERLDLYAGVRPIRPLRGLPLKLADPRAAGMDFVLVREQTEGLFSERGRTRMKGDEEARDAMVITRRGSARVFDFALRLAQRRKARGHAGKVTCVDKANVLGSMAFFRRIFEDRARAFPDIAVETSYVDAMALNLVMKPWSYDVLVTENLFGDILSDLGAGLVGGMGMAPSGDIGEDHALFQPAHGSAPDIAGTGRANPTAAVLSAAMMLEWLEERCGVSALGEAARTMQQALENVLAGGAVRPYEFGGSSGTSDITRAIVEAVKDTPIRSE